MKKIIIIFLIISQIFLISACSNSDNSISGVDKPNNSTDDEIYPAQKENAIENSKNVNGKRFNITLLDFTNQYNSEIVALGQDDIIDNSEWKKTGTTQKDSNGVNFDYYYYDGKKYNFTATVETESNKILNIGCGTTTHYFVSEKDNVKNSDIILDKTALMSAIVCGFPSNSKDVLKQIFYTTTLDNNNSFWYEGCIYTCSVKINKVNDEKSGILFRIFPVKDSLKKEWNVVDYSSYLESSTKPTT